MAINVTYPKYGFTDAPYVIALKNTGTAIAAVPVVIGGETFAYKIEPSQTLKIDLAQALKPYAKPPVPIELMYNENSVLCFISNSEWRLPSNTLKINSIAINSVEFYMGRVSILQKKQTPEQLFVQKIVSYDHIIDEPYILNPFFTSRTNGTAIYFYQEEMLPLMCIMSPLCDKFIVKDLRGKKLMDITTGGSYKNVFVDFKRIMQEYDENYLCVIFGHTDQYTLYPNKYAENAIHIFKEPTPASRQKYLCTFLNGYGIYERLLLFGEGSGSISLKESEEMPQKYNATLGVYEPIYKTREVDTQKITLRAGYNTRERQNFIADMLTSPQITIQMPSGEEVQAICTTTELPLWEDGKDYLEAEITFDIH